MKKVIIFGSSGRLGSYLLKQLKLSFKIYPVGKQSNKYKINLLNFKEVCKIINSISPDIIINCAASTNVNKCIKNYTYAFKGNVLVPRTIVKALYKVNKKIHLIHFSTDQIYNGKKNKRNKESDIRLSNNYSKTKYLGENEITKSLNYTIIRTNFFGKLNYGNLSFSQMIIKNLKNKKIIKLPSNIIYSPIHLKILIKFIKEIIRKKIYGIYNLGSKDKISKYQLAIKLAEYFKLKKELIISYKSIYKKDKRPLNTALSNEKIKKRINLKIPNIKDMVSLN